MLSVNFISQVGNTVRLLATLFIFSVNFREYKIQLNPMNIFGVAIAREN